MLHWAPAATLEPQLLVWLKSPLGGATETVNAAVPELIKTMLVVPLGVLSTWLPNVMGEVGTLTWGAGGITVPDSINVRGLFSAVEVTLSVPATAPAASDVEGANTTLRPQFEPSARAFVD